ncbi:hypothetical protein GT040_16865, partial [Streptomyces sp. SID2119]|nr:hypothetical protein [Streptomyces sp. SID2119]
MSSSDQQYPYPYDPQPQPQQHQHPQAPQDWPDGTAGQSALPQEPGGHDQGGTQTWQAPTWDTQYQPTIRRDPQPYQGQVQGYGQQQPAAYGSGQPDSYGTPQPQYQEPQHQQPYQEPLH